MESKAYRLGTHRTLLPAETLKRVQPLLPGMGITRVANVTGLDRVGIPVYTAFRPMSRSISVSQGKGLEKDAAKVSALMESIETYHAETITRPLKYASINQLADIHKLVDVDKLARSSSRPMHTDQPVFWIEGENLLDNRSCWLPFETVSTDYTLPGFSGSGIFAANTNGLASGNTYREAICHAIFEIVERDAEALWRQQAVGRQMAAGLNTDSIDDANCRWLIERFMNADIELKIWDITSDVGLPCYICLVMGGESDWADPEFGAGCHASREIALCRALTEAAQARATYIAGSRDDIGLSEYKSSQRQRRRIQGLQQFQRHQPVRKFYDTGSSDTDYIEDDLQQCLDLLRAVGIEQVVAVDLTKAELSLPVTKVVIPGLEGAYGHWHSRYMAGSRAKARMNLPFEVA